MYVPWRPQQTATVNKSGEVVRVSGRIDARGAQIGVAVGLLDGRKRDATDGGHRTVGVAGCMRHRTVGPRDTGGAGEPAREGVDEQLVQRSPVAPREQP